ncbi:hypothetical protein P4S52_17315 [Vibrio sp. SA48]
MEKDGLDQRIVLAKRLGLDVDKILVDFPQEYQGVENSLRAYAGKSFVSLSDGAQTIDMGYQLNTTERSE